MKKPAVHRFRGTIDIIGINPYVRVPEDILQDIFAQAGRDKGAIPVKGTVNKKPYTQTLVKYAGIWRFYINTVMLERSPKRVGEMIDISISYNAMPPVVTIPKAFTDALQKDTEAKTVFDGLSPSLQKEITRYLSYLKTEDSLNKNILRALNFLKGKERFLGRDSPK